MTTKRERLYRLLDIIEEFEDNIRYGVAYRPFNNVVSSKKEALVNYDKEEAEIIRLVRKYQRDLVAAGISSLIQAFKKNITKNTELFKAWDYEIFQKWQEDLGAKIPAIQENFKNKMIVPLTISYGKGYNKGIEDLGFEPMPERSWFYLPGHAVPRLTALKMSWYISRKVSLDMVDIIMDGMREGLNGREIGRNLRKVSTAPKVVNVAPKVVDGVVTRKGYSYTIPNRRWTEMIGRTEANRATTMGRVESYNTSKMVKSLEHITAGDKRVCPICEPLDGKVYTLAEAGKAIPVHVMCRCTVEVHEYYSDAKPEKAEENFKLDDVDRTINTAPISWGNAPLVRWNTRTRTLAEDMKRYERHLKARGLNTVKGRKQVYERLEKQLYDLKVTQLKGFKSADIRRLYTMHTVKNTRHEIARNIIGKDRIKPTTIELKKEYKRVPRAYASTTTNKFNRFGGQGYDSAYQLELYSKNSFRPERTVLNLQHSIAHEMGHQLHYESSKDFIKTWGEEFLRTKENVKVLSWKPYIIEGETIGKQPIMNLREAGFVTNYATVKHTEDFAESFATYVYNPNDLKLASSRKYKLMKDFVE